MEKKYQFEIFAISYALGGQPVAAMAYGGEGRNRVRWG